MFCDEKSAVRLRENWELLSVPFRVCVVPQNVVKKGHYETFWYVKLGHLVQKGCDFVSGILGGQS